MRIARQDFSQNTFSLKLRAKAIVVVLVFFPPDLTSYLRDLLYSSASDDDILRLGEGGGLWRESRPRRIICLY